MAGHWMINLSLLDRWGFQKQLIRLVELELVRAAIGDRWLNLLKNSISYITTENSQRLVLDKLKGEVSQV